MFRKYISVFAIGLLASFVSPGCGGNEPEDCAKCNEYAGGAVKCFIGLSSPQVMCAPDQSLAAISCTEGGGTYVPMDLCPAEADETTGEEQTPRPWQPGLDVALDARTGEYVIAQEPFEELKLSPASLFEDKSELSQTPTGHYELLRGGQLSEALGWETGDVFIDLNGHELRGMNEFSTAFTALEDATTFALIVLRDGRELVLRYRLE